MVGAWSGGYSQFRVFLCGQPALGNMDSSYILDSRFRGNATVGLARRVAASCFIRLIGLYLPEPTLTSCRGSESARTPQIVVIEPSRYSQSQTVNETASPRQKPGANHRFAILEYKEGTPWKNTSNSLVCNKLWQKTGVSVYSLSTVNLKCYPRKCSTMLRGQKTSVSLVPAS